MCGAAVAGSESRLKRERTRLRGKTTAFLTQNPTIAFGKLRDILLDGVETK